MDCPLCGKIAFLEKKSLGNFALQQTACKTPTWRGRCLGRILVVFLSLALAVCVSASDWRFFVVRSEQSPE